MSLRILLSPSFVVRSVFLRFDFVWIFVSGYAVFPALKAKFEEAMKRNDVRAVVLTGKFRLQLFFSSTDWLIVLVGNYFKNFVIFDWFYLDQVGS